MTARKKTKKPHGRPSKYTPELAQKICDELASGRSLRSVCGGEGMPSWSTVLSWRDSNKEFSDQYARARLSGYEQLADGLVDISDDNAGDPQRDRLRVDTRKWLLSKMLPKIYGDKLDVQHGGTDVLLEALAAAGERARNVPRG